MGFNFCNFSLVGVMSNINKKQCTIKARKNKDLKLLKVVDGEDQTGGES